MPSDSNPIEILPAKGNERQSIHPQTYAGIIKAQEDQPYHWN